MLLEAPLLGAAQEPAQVDLVNRHGQRIPCDGDMPPDVSSTMANFACSSMATISLDGRDAPRSVTSCMLIGLRRA